MTIPSVYYGIIANNEWEIHVARNGKLPTPLNPRLGVSNHSPTGYAWGYAGSGPAQTALALVCDVVGIRRAKPIYQTFKFRHIATLPKDEEWIFKEDQILGWIRAIEAEKKQATQLTEVP